jgi:uncharacterized protein (TIGR02266 family)
MDQRRNHRKFSRHRLEAEIEIGDGFTGGELIFDSHDVSKGGLFLKSDLLFEVGKVFWISFTFPGTQMAVRTRGQVVWVKRNPDENDPTDQAGMGIQFMDLSETEQAALDAYLSED